MFSNKRRLVRKYAFQTALLLIKHLSMRRSRQKPKGEIHCYAGAHTWQSDQGSASSPHNAILEAYSQTQFC